MPFASGPGLGCMVNTERILETLCNNGESMVSPTHFMQSTHNTIASLLAIHTKSHGYNITYSHKDLSSDLALLDAWMQFRLGRIHTALVGGYDELTPSYYTLLRRIGYMGAEGAGPGAEASGNAASDRRLPRCLVRNGRHPDSLSSDRHSVADRSSIDSWPRPGVSREELSAVLTGVNGNRANDAFYEAFTSQLLPEIPTLHYKHLFGTSYTASAYAPYVAAHCLKRETLPECLAYGAIPTSGGTPRTLLSVNQCDGRQYSLQLFRSVCGN